jgi:NTE family protein
MGEIADLFRRKLGESSTESPREFKNPTVESTGKGIPDSLWQHIQREAQSGVLTNREINDHLRSIYSVGNFKDVFAEVIADSDGSRIVYTAKETPLLQSLEFVGCKAISPDTLVSKFLPLLRKPVNYRLGEKALADILRIYRSKGYSLARIDSTSFEQESGIMRVVINEGVIHRIDVQGGIRSQDYFVLREFPLEKGDVFEIDKANQGLTNINSTTLFEYVYLEVAYNSGEPVLTIRLRERPSQLLRLGLRADNERSLQGSIDIRDENFRGSGTELGLSAAGGGRNQEVVLEYRAHRLFNTYLTFNVSGFYTARNSFTYDDAPSTTPNHWDREQVGEYRDIHYGGRLVFGSQVERFGTVTAELILQNIRIKSLENAEDLEDRYRLSMVRFGSVVDSKDSYPFPQSGIGMNISYEFAFRGLGSERGYNAFRMMYESYSTWGTRHTFHPRLTLGFADQTMPLSQQFRLGGRETFFGLREDDRRGRQLLLLNMEYRYHLPVSILFDTYCSLRYDIGMISSIPEEVKFNTLRHGVGAELSLESPIGPAIFGVGKSFNLSRDLPENPIQQGPLLFYFMIGYQL